MNRLTKISQLTSKVRRLERLLYNTNARRRDLSQIERLGIERELIRTVDEYQQVYQDKH